MGKHIFRGLLSKDLQPDIFRMVEDGIELFDSGIEKTFPLNYYKQKHGKTRGDEHGDINAWRYYAVPTK